MTNPYIATETTLHEADGDTYEPRMCAWRGRIGRLRLIAYGWGFVALVAIPFGLLGALIEAPSPAMAGALPLAAPVLGGAVQLILGRRRLNDMGHQGWWAIGTLIPLVNVVMTLWLLLGRGDPHPNEYGPVPARNSPLLVAVALLVPVVAILGLVASVVLPDLMA